MYVSMSTVLISLKITICSSNYLNFIMIENNPIGDTDEQIRRFYEANPDIDPEFMKKIKLSF